MWLTMNVQMPESKTIPLQGYSRSVSDLRLFSAKVRRLPKLSIELTDRCNNNCRHCYINRPAWDSRAIEREMRTGFIKNLILQAADLGCFDLRFTGGEPLLREDFAELYVFSRRNGFSVLLSTNARLVTPELADLFKELPPGKPIDITTYGMYSETYENAARAKGSYEQFRRGVDLLEQNRIDFVLKMAVLPENRLDVPAYEDWIKNLSGVRRRPAYISSFSQRARHDDPEKNRRIRELRSRPEETVDFLARAHDYESDLRNFCRQYSGRKGETLFTCGFGESVCVDAYGLAQGCVLMRHPETLYDLHSGTLEEALFGYFPKIHDRRAMNPLFLERCADCCLRGLCEQCPAKSWMEHGTLDTPVEFLCRVAHAQARKLGLLNAEENGWEISDWQSRLNLTEKAV